LTYGDSKSCGCIKSWGETQLIFLLNEANIPYKREITFSDLRGTRGGCLRFDFGVYDQNNNLICLIEYDGRQHKKYDVNWNQTPEEFEQLKTHDKLKNDYCQKNNILLYRLNKDSNLSLFVGNLSKTAGGS
jgi:hypothetical protein